MAPTVQVEQALAAIGALGAAANSIAAAFFEARMTYGKRAEEFDNREEIGVAVDTAFLQLLNLAEALGLNHLCNIIAETHRRAQELGLSKVSSFEDLSAWSYWSGPLEKLAESIAVVYGIKKASAGNVTLDLATVLRNMQRAITSDTFSTPPQKESEVHDRIETILRCIYPDLIRKPPISKHVTSFIPDTGLPSIRTLLEYKFLSEEVQAGPMANEILADTRGYTDGNWDRIIFVIYETRRFKSLEEWKQLLRTSGVPDSMEVVLLHGEPPIKNKLPGASPK